VEKEGAAPRRRAPRLIAAQVCAALNQTKARYLVIGGVACILHGYVRATEDVDILIERTRENAQRVLAGLAAVGYGFAREWGADEILKRPITVIGDDPAVDVFTVAWKIKYEQAAKRSSVVEVEGVSVPLIALDDLIETKRTGRLQDAADIEVLEEIKRLRGPKR
jgi:predicted nucleotidyltransferase